MRARSYLLAFLGGLLLVSPGIASAQKLDKDDKTFLDGVRPILLADEEKFFKNLKEKSDRLEFQKIFWARRDPDLATPANEYQVQFEKARDDADRLYKMPAQPGSLTDCGRTYILLGKPDEVQAQPGNVAPGLRAPEMWMYKDKAGRTFAGGKTRSRSTRSAAPQPRSPRSSTASRPRTWCSRTSTTRRTRTAASSSSPTCSRRTRRPARS